jgi:amino acid transporter
MAKKKLRLVDVMLSIICVVFTIEACAPAAAIGNSSVFWWLFLFVTFLIPYGLIVAELGTTYAEGAGVYEWVRDALGRRWATREAWYYWVNYFTWLASISVLFPTTIGAVLGRSLPSWASVAIELAFIWFVVWVSMRDVGDLSGLMNLGAVINVVMAVGIGGLGIWYGTTHGFASPLTPRSLLPNFGDPTSITYLSVIIYNYMGCEVVATFVDSMESPQRDMPKAIVTSGLTIVVIYLFVSLGISTAVPHGSIALDSGITDAVGIMAGKGSPVFMLVSVGFLVSCFANMISWSHGVSSVTNRAAKEGNLPQVFGQEDEKGRHLGSCLATGVCASILVIAGPILDDLGVGVFYTALSLDIVFTLAAYLPMFPAFLRLRRIDPDRPRPFRVPGGRVLNQLFCWVPVAELVLSMAVSLVPLNGTAPQLRKLPLLALTVAVMLAGELVRHVSYAHATARAEVLGVPLPAAQMGPDCERRQLRRHPRAYHVDSPARDRRRPVCGGLWRAL